MQIKLVGFFLLILLPNVMFGWASMEHKIISEIAWQNLTPEAKYQVKKLSKNFADNQNFSSQFSTQSVWMDTLRPQQINAYNHWHYINTPYYRNGYHPKKSLPENSDHVVWALKQAKQALMSPTATLNNRSYFLPIYVHLVEDIHQPLHTVSGVDKEHPFGDHGGTLISLNLPNTKNLHQLWDQACGYFPQSTKVNNEIIRSAARQLQKQFPEQDFADQIQMLDPTVWQQEGEKIAIENVYPQQGELVINQTYLDKNKTIAARRMTLAGYRLAESLNQIFHKAHA